MDAIERPEVTEIAGHVDCPNHGAVYFAALESPTPSFESANSGSFLARKCVRGTPNMEFSGNPACNYSSKGADSAVAGKRRGGRIAQLLEAGGVDARFRAVCSCLGKSFRAIRTGSHRPAQSEIRAVEIETDSHERAPGDRRRTLSYSIFQRTRNGLKHQQLLWKDFGNLLGGDPKGSDWDFEIGAEPPSRKSVI